MNETVDRNYIKTTNDLLFFVALMITGLIALGMLQNCSLEEQRGQVSLMQVCVDAHKAGLEVVSCKSGKTEEEKK